MTAFPTIAAVLTQPDTPAVLLRWLKARMKQAIQVRPATLPKPVAMYIYYAAIAAAVVRHGDTLAQLPPADICRGLAWAAARPWGVTELRETLRIAATRLEPQG